MTFLWSKLASSVLKRTGLALVAYLTGPVVAGVLQGWGITAANDGTVSISLFALFEAFRNYVKHKGKVTWL